MKEQTTFKPGDLVHVDYNPPFNNRDGEVIEVVLRDQSYKYREKYLIEIEYKMFGFLTCKKRDWFIGTTFISKKINK